MSIKGEGLFVISFFRENKNLFLSNEGTVISKLKKKIKMVFVWMSQRYEIQGGLPNDGRALTMRYLSNIFDTITTKNRNILFMY